MWHLLTVTLLTVQCAHLGDKLDDFDKDIEGHVSGDHAAGAFGEKCCYDGVKPTGNTKKRACYPQVGSSTYAVMIFCNEILKQHISLKITAKTWRNANANTGLWEIFTLVSQCCSHTWSWSCKPTAVGTETPAQHEPFSGLCSVTKRRLSKKVSYI